MTRIQTITDDLGHKWRFYRGRIRVIGDRTKDGGYNCRNLGDGAKVLEKLGYITSSSNAEAHASATEGSR